MPGAPSISVVLSVRNGGYLLSLAVLSLIQQSFRDWELILIDDGSTDHAAERVAGLDRRIRLFKDGKSKGLAARLNEAIHLARGRYIARMDHDDIAHPERLRCQFEFLESNPSVDVVGARCIAIDQEDRILGYLPAGFGHEDICARPWLGFHLAHPTWMGRRNWFLANPYAEPAPYRCEDQELLLRTHKTARFAALEDSMLAYRTRSHTPLRVLIRTRVALAKVQFNYFIAQGEVLSLTLALAALLGRLAIDSVPPARLFVAGRRARSEVSKTDREFWRKLLAEIRVLSPT